MDPYLANITLFGGNFAPLYWAFCNGALLSIAENTALFSLIGTTYGGDGQTTFALPDLRGRIPVGTGQGPGLPNVDLGEVWGTENVNILVPNMPAHVHQVISSSASLKANSDAGGQPNPQNNYLGVAQTSVYASSASGGAFMQYNNAMVTTSIAGSGQPINVVMPYLALNYIIAVEGIYPSRN